MKEFMEKFHQWLTFKLESLERKVSFWVACKLPPGIALTAFVRVCAHDGESFNSYTAREHYARWAKDHKLNPKSY